MRTVSCHFHFPAASSGDVHGRITAADDRIESGARTPELRLFHAAWSKNAFIADALDRLHPAPALLCDADVVLPAELRERMESLLAKCPERAILYGLAGRRLCARVPAVGLPSIRLERHRSVIGYVQFTKENDPGPGTGHPGRSSAGPDSQAPPAGPSGDDDPSIPDARGLL